MSDADNEQGTGPEQDAVHDQILFGLSDVDPKRTVTMPLKDLLYVHQAIGEWIRFFHQPLHFPNLEAVERFVGSLEDEGLGALARSYYDILSNVWPEDIRAAFDDGRFDHPDPPFYYRVEGAADADARGIDDGESDAAKNDEG